MINDDDDSRKLPNKRFTRRSKRQQQASSSSNKSHHRRALAVLFVIAVTSIWVYVRNTQNELVVNIHAVVKVVSSSVESPASQVSTVTTTTTTTEITFTEFQCPIRFYVYDLPFRFAGKVEDWLEDTIRNATADGTKVNENMLTERELLRYFRTSQCRTQDPSHADYFFVPYMHCVDCMRHPYVGIQCRGVPEQDTRQLLQYLPYYWNATTKPRHIFLNGWGTYMGHPLIQTMPMTLTVGPKAPAAGISNTSILVPPIHPSWHTRSLLVDQPRTISMALFTSTINPRMRGASQRKYRKFFLDHARQHWHNQTVVAGLPHALVDWSHPSNSKSNQQQQQQQEELQAIYQTAIFCPVLPGDVPWQRRFFDVMMNGCLPMVMEYHPALEENDHENDHGNDGRTWYTPEFATMAQVQRVYPLWPGTVARACQVDYDSFVVRIPGQYNHTEHDYSHVPGILNDIVHTPGELERRRLAMREAVLKLAYGGTEQGIFPNILMELARLTH